MADLSDELTTAYEDEGYDVSEVTTNRDRVRVVLVGEVGAESARSIVHSVLGEEPRFGVNVTTEALDSQDDVSTVVSFRN